MLFFFFFVKKKRSLKALLDDTSFQMDYTLAYRFMTDIAKGMNHLSQEGNLNTKKRNKHN